MKKILKVVMSVALMQISLSAFAVCETDDDGNYRDAGSCSSYQAQQGRRNASSPTQNIAGGAQTAGGKLIDSSCSPTYGTCQTYTTCPAGMTCVSVSSYGSGKVTELNTLKDNTVVTTPRRTAITDVKNPQTWAGTVKGDIDADRTNRKNNREATSVGTSVVDPLTGVTTYNPAPVYGREQAAVTAHDLARRTVRDNRDATYVTHVSNLKTVVAAAITANTGSTDYTPTLCTDPPTAACDAYAKEHADPHSGPGVQTVKTVNSLKQNRQLDRQLKVLRRKDAANTAAGGAVINKF